MPRTLHFLIRYPVLQATIILMSLVVWAGTGLFDLHLARADGACGHFCAEGYSNGVDAVCGICGCVSGDGFVSCAEGVICGDQSKCVYCCVGCVPPPGAPPGANGCWSNDPTPTPSPIPPTPAPTSTPNCNIFGPPTLDADVVWTPNFPIVVGQKADSRVTVTFNATGGASRTCSSVPPASITRLQVMRVDLSPTSAAWITGELARYYPNATVKELYPLNPNPTTIVTGLGTPNAVGSITFTPKDPGWYEVLARVTQSDGQTAQRTYRVPVYLLGSTTIR